MAAAGVPGPPDAGISRAGPVGIDRRVAMQPAARTFGIRIAPCFPAKAESVRIKGSVRARESA